MTTKPANNQPACHGHGFEICTCRDECRHRLTCSYPPRVKGKRGSKESDKNRLVRILDRDIADAGLPTPVKEYVFCADRLWRADRAWPDHRLLVEVQGGIYTGQKSGHTSMWGVLGDCEKYDTAVLEGWRVLLLPGQFIEGATLSKPYYGMGCEVGPCKRCSGRKGRGCTKGFTPKRGTYSDRVKVKKCAVDMIAEALGMGAK